jgi:hypothetical protein
VHQQEAELDARHGLIDIDGHLGPYDRSDREVTAAEQLADVQVSPSTPRQAERLAGALPVLQVPVNGQLHIGVLERREGRADDRQRQRIDAEVAAQALHQRALLGARAMHDVLEERRERAAKGCDLPIVHGPTLTCSDVADTVAQVLRPGARRPGRVIGQLGPGSGPGSTPAARRARRST